MPDQAGSEIGRIVSGSLSSLDESGLAVTTEPMLSAIECAELRDSFGQDELFRKTVEMGPVGYGEGAYRYYRAPLPEVVQRLRAYSYPPLAQLANQWRARLGVTGGYPDNLDDFLDRCSEAGQRRPTPLVLRYRTGGWNALHQDIYGKVYFPIQLTLALTAPGRDFAGGENLFVERIPGRQPRGSSASVPLGHAVIFPTRDRPVSVQGSYREAEVTHGVSTVSAGERMTLGIIFHNAR